MVSLRCVTSEILLVYWVVTASDLRNMFVNSRCHIKSAHCRIYAIHIPMAIGSVPVEFINILQGIELYILSEILILNEWFHHILWSHQSLITNTPSSPIYNLAAYDFAFAVEKKKMLVLLNSFWSCTVHSIPCAKHKNVAKPTKSALKSQFTVDSAVCTFSCCSVSQQYLHVTGHEQYLSVWFISLLLFLPDKRERKWFLFDVFRLMDSFV